ncbi:imelysin family protein [Ferrimonas marina]|uniref:Predicted lipoprotein n=1 Tax=Ferrimonas marina TaxID=299255 RepID=A0A1M5YHJ2_9GAMM|nr:imelysin family protein [Ferrimonas marina]SHI11394.1 Predicted lipoprotein [Ferrimonas marina]
MKWQLTPIALSLLLLAGCGESGSSEAGPDYGSGGGSNPPPTPTPGEFDQAELVANLVDNVITPTFTSAQQLAAELTPSLAQYCQALSSGGDASAAGGDAQQTWLALMAQWQQAELMQIGPLGSEATLRNRIYSYPVVNRCAVDQDVAFFEAGNINGNPYDITVRTDTRKGLDALEHLLFAPDADHRCPDNLAPAGWNARPEAERWLARCQFAEAVAADLEANLALLQQQWASYAEQLKSAGEPGSEFSDVHQAVNAISDGLFYLDGLTKDAKLGVPLQGFAGACLDEECLSTLESGFSASSIDNVVNNLVAFKSLFEGLEGAGFDDYLNDVGNPELAQRMVADLDAVIVDGTTYPGPLSQVLTEDPERVAQTQAGVKTVTDQLKVDFISSLALELPPTAAGDND